MSETTYTQIFTDQAEKDLFRMDVEYGLSKSNKQLPSKYFYNQRGDELYDEITHHPDYYLTRCENEIIETYKNELSRLFTAKPFNLIELGPGDGSKGNILIEKFYSEAFSFQYTPVDISEDYLNKIITELSQQFPEINLAPHLCDYFNTSIWAQKKPDQRNIVLFLGSNMGNFDMPATKKFLRHLWRSLRHDDYVLIGLDLLKDIDILMRAYNDDKGITNDFNLNLLQRINDELGGNFRLEKFKHYGTYNVYSGAMESYLISQEAQVVKIDALNKSFTFKPFESIRCEYSFKYSLPQIEQLALDNGFEVMRNFTDSKGYFVDSLWRVKKKWFFI